MYQGRTLLRVLRDVSLLAVSVFLALSYNGLLVNNEIGSFIAEISTETKFYSVLLNTIGQFEILEFLCEYMAKRMRT
jgi:hypothetical protein